MEKFSAIVSDPLKIRIDQNKDDGTQQAILLVVGGKVMLAASSFPLEDLPEYLNAVKSLVGGLQSLNLLSDEYGR